MIRGAWLNIICLGAMAVNRQRCAHRLLERQDLIALDQRRKDLT